MTYFRLTFAVKSESPTETWRSHSEAFSPVHYACSAAGVRLDYYRPPICQSQMALSPTPQRVSVGKLVNHVLERDSAKLTGQVTFKETAAIMERLEALAARQRRPVTFVARAIFRIGMKAVEDAIEGGLLS